MKKRSSIVIILIMVVTTGISLLVSSAQTNKETVKLEVCPSPLQETLSKVQDTFPVVEYFSQFESENQKKRSEKYDQGLPVLSADADIPKNLEAVLAFDPGKDLPALPIDKCEIVILGKIVDAKAHLSDKKTIVYSEFKIEIENVFKNSAKEKFKDAKFVIAEREGGVVIYPSGNKFWYHVLGQKMPEKGQRYVLFLTSNFPVYGRQNEDLYLLSAFELKKGQAFPLDRHTDSYARTSAYEGKDESILLNDLKSLLRDQ